MYIKAHCFLEKARIGKTSIVFELSGVKVRIINTSKMGNTEEGMEIEIIQKVDPGEFKISKEEMDERGLFIAKRLRKYRTKLQGVAFLIEGILAANYNVNVPPFNTSKIMVNVYPENEKEKKMLEEGKITRGFGDIFVPEKKIEFKWNNDILGDINRARQHLPALSFFAQALRSQERGDQEIAFFLFFRILEGYFGDGSGKNEECFIRNKGKLSKYLKYDKKIKSAFKKFYKKFFNCLPNQRRGLKDYCQILHFCGINLHTSTLIILRDILVQN